MPKTCNNSSTWFQQHCSNRKKNKASTRRRCGKPNSSTKNYVVYNKCHLWNLMRRTPKDHMKQLCPPKAKPKVKPAAACNPEKVKSLHENDSEKLLTTPPIDPVEVQSMCVMNPEKVKSALFIGPENVKPASTIDSENSKSTLPVDLQNVTSPLVTGPEKVLENKDEAAETLSAASLIDGLATSLVRTRLTLLDQKKRRRSKSTSKKTRRR